MTFSPGDLIWAKMPGYPHWQARIDVPAPDEKIPPKKFAISFFGTHETAVMWAKNLLPYEENRDRFSTNSKRPRRGFKEALAEIVENLKVKWEMRGQEFREHKAFSRMDEQLWSTPFFIFKKGQVTPLFKKDDESNKANYRRVTVLPVLNNIYKRLLAAQLGEFYSAILSDFISSYRKFYSCETALLRMTEDWRCMRDRGELVVIVSMDLSKAFDVIQHDLLLAKLKAYGVGEGGCTLLKNYLSGRQQQVEIGDTFSN